MPPGCGRNRAGPCGGGATFVWRPRRAGAREAAPRAAVLPNPTPSTLNPASMAPPVHYDPPQVGRHDGRPRIAARDSAQEE